MPENKEQGVKLRRQREVPRGYRSAQLDFDLPGENPSTVRRNTRLGIAALGILFVSGLIIINGGTPSASGNVPGVQERKPAEQTPPKEEPKKPYKKPILDPNRPYIRGLNEAEDDEGREVQV